MTPGKRVSASFRGRCGVPAVAWGIAEILRGTVAGWGLAGERAGEALFRVVVCVAGEIIDDDASGEDEMMPPKGSPSPNLHERNRTDLTDLHLPYTTEEVSTPQ